MIISTKDQLEGREFRPQGRETGAAGLVSEGGPS